MSGIHHNLLLCPSGTGENYDRQYRASPQLPWRGSPCTGVLSIRLGGDLVIVTYKDLGQVKAPEDADQVIWGQVASESGFKVMAFDATERVPFERGQNSFYVAARFSTADEAKSRWEKLKSDASIRHELGPALWSPMYGMLQDKFGIVWVVDVPAEAHA